MLPEITIEMFPAGNGDAILISLGDSIWLIDGGYTSTYRDHLKYRLKSLHQEGKKISRYIITHIDADHISGAIAFIRENGPANQPEIIGIDEVWFNSYRHLQLKEKKSGDLEGKKPVLRIRGGFESAEADVRDGLVSHVQGTTLGSLLLRYGYRWNHSFGNEAAKANQPLKFDLDNGISATVLNPTQESLDNLATKWYDYLKLKFTDSINEDAFFDDAFELMMEEMRQTELDEVMQSEETLVAGANDWVEQHAVGFEKEDRSETNASSITFLLEYQGKKMLFLGDAIPSQVISQLKELIPTDEQPLHLDLLKVAHHGAWSNNNPEIFEWITADYFLFSSNGFRHQHPHLSTLAWILKKCRSDTSKTFAFNYRQVDRLMALDDPDIQKKYNYKVLWPDVNLWGQGNDGYLKIDL